MVDMTHDGNHRRARLELFRLVLRVHFQLQNRLVNHTGTPVALLHFKTEPVFGA